MGKREAIPAHIELELLVSSARRCCLCFGVDHDYIEKIGQIAHLDGEPSNTKSGNLAWLCLEHHDKYDGKTSQSKNYTIAEIKRYRDDLYKEVAARRAEASATTDINDELVPESQLKDDIRALLGNINPRILKLLDEGNESISVMISLPKLSALQQLQSAPGFGNLLRLDPTGSVNTGFGNRIGNAINDVNEGFLQGFILYPQDGLQSF